VEGVLRVPGDKSISHRALILAALAEGESRIREILPSADVQSTAGVLRALGVDVAPFSRDLRVVGRGTEALRAPDRDLDCGNSGTTTRLMAGVTSACPFSSRFVGDASLSLRPMQRVARPLTAMGARFEFEHGDGLPMIVHGGPLKAISWATETASAQIKSAILLAGLTGGVEVELREPHGRSRDHTERLLRAFGYPVIEREGWILFRPSGALEPFEIQVPGDPSSAAFLVGAAALAEGGELRVAEVGVNPTRIGFLGVLARMGVRVDLASPTEQFGEPVADLLVRPAELRATEVHPGEIPGLIDEIPLLAVLASRAEGTTVFRQVGELRVKESDRLGLIAENLRSVGARAEVSGDDLYVEGGQAAPRGRVRTAADHRLAMAFAVLGTLPGARVSIDDMACAAVSFPNFPETLRGIRTPGVGLPSTRLSGTRLPGTRRESA
jgi:3-phosphoshikimate 1-carboxyvinyltransferase